MSEQSSNPEAASQGKAGEYNIAWLVSPFEKFTERTRKVLTFAAEEAATLNHPAIAPEHLLLGLIREGAGVGALALQQLGVDPQTLRQRVVDALNQQIPRTEGQPGKDIGLTAPARKVIELAVQEASLLKHHYIGTEHLLLALLREDENQAAKALGALGVTLEAARAQVVQILASMARDAASAGPKTNVIACRVESRDLDAIDALIEVGIRTTRSDAASWLISAGIQANHELFERVKASVGEIRRLRAEAQTLARQMSSGDSPSPS